MKKLFGKRLRELRTQKGLTQEKMAELIGIQPENYSRIELGHSFPKPENLLKMSQALSVELPELFQFQHFTDTEQILQIITEKLTQDAEARALVYKFLKALGKI